MPAQVRFYDTDNVTVISSFSFGSIPSPGTSAPKKFYLENYGNVALESTLVSLAQVGTNDGDDYSLLALDSGGVPGSFTQSPLSLGTVGVGVKVAFWAKEVIPSGLTADLNQRAYVIRATGTTI